MSSLEHLAPEASNASRDRERDQHRRVLDLIMPAMPETATQNLILMRDYLKSNEENSLHDLFTDAIRYRARFRRGVEAGGPTEQTVSNLQIAEEMVARLTFVTKIARMQQYAEPGEKSALLVEIRTTEALPADEQDFWLVCTNVLLEDEGTCWPDTAVAETEGD